MNLYVRGITAATHYVDWHL